MGGGHSFRSHMINLKSWITLESQENTKRTLPDFTNIKATFKKYP